MAHDQKIKMSFDDGAGNYYYATPNSNGTWNVLTSTSLAYLKYLPDGWNKTAITWERDTNYMGIFRSMSSASVYKFAKDARAIIQAIRSAQGIMGNLKLTIYLFNTATYNYDVLYRSSLDFTSYSDSVRDEKLSISTLDSDLIRDVHAFGDTQYNIPMWVPDGLGGWLDNDTFFVVHDGIKVLYNSTWVTNGTATGSSTPQYQILPVAGSGSVVAIGGFNNGARGGGGKHFIPVLQQYQATQNNGSTTYIGNTILQALLVQLNQSNSVNGYDASSSGGENDFAGTNNSRPYSSSNCLLKNLLNNAGTTASNLKMSVNIMVNNLAVDCITINPSSLIFALFEIDEFDNPVVVSSRYTYTNLHSILLAFGSNALGNINVTTTVTLNYSKAYMVCLLCDDVTGAFPVAPTSGISALAADSFQISFLSAYDGGASGTPTPAPSYPPSVMAAFRPHKLLSKLVPALATTNTDQNGFPIAVSTPFTGVSNYLSDPAAALKGDARPYQVAWTSAYCMQNLSGQSYVTTSLNMLFNFFKKQFGCGAAIENDLSGNPTVFRIEDLTYFFDNTTMILDLGSDVAQLEIEQLTEGLSANLKIGYTAADTNSNFGVDSFNTNLFFNTPASVLPGTMDYEDDDVLTDQYPIEIARAQRTSQPIGSSISPENPSTNNQNIAFYCQPSPAPFVLPNIAAYPASCQMYDPSNNPVGVQPYQLTMRDGVIYPGVPCMQNTDSTAASAPFCINLFYPDRAINMELSPCRALQRSTGALLRSVLDTMHAEYLTFRNTYVMQYNNTTLGLTGIQSNLDIGSGAAGLVNEFSDKLIGDLPAQLFKPILLKVKSRYPVNMYEIINSNPRGYIRFVWTDKYNNTKEYKGFIWKVTQSAGDNAATDFELLATPDMVI